MKNWKNLMLSGMAIFVLSSCGNDNGDVQQGTAEESESRSSESIPASSQQESSTSTTESSSSEQNSQAADSTTVDVSMQEAVDIYLNEYPNAQIEEIEFEKEHGRWIYELSGALGDREYELEIDAESGEIVDRDEDDLDQNNRYLNLDKIIDPTEAVEIALQEIGEDAILDGWELEVETHNGQDVPVYEIEFSNDNREVDVHGETGEILEIDH